MIKYNQYLHHTIFQDLSDLRLRFIHPLLQDDLL